MTSPTASSPSPGPADTHGFQTVAPLPSRLSHQITSTGYLESWTLGYTLVAIAIALLATLIITRFVARRRGRRLLPAIPRAVLDGGVGLLSFLVLVAGIGVLVNAYAGYVPTLSTLFSPPGTTTVIPRTLLHNADDALRSRVIRLDIPGRAYGMNSGTTYVYVPPGYDQPANALRRYPSVYLIHGYPGRAADWFTAGELQRTMDLLLKHHLVRPMIVVSPTASTGYLDDDECLNASTARPRVETYLVFDVVDSIDRTFRTLPNRSYRAFGGMSSGGYCALNIGIHHPHRFGVVLASEPYGTPGENAFKSMLHGNETLLRINDVNWLVPHVRFRDRTSFFLDAGSRDLETKGETYAIARGLADRGQVVAYRAVGDVGHTWREAERALPYALIFASQQFGHVPKGGSDAADAAELRTLFELAHRELTGASPFVSPAPYGSPSGSPSGSPAPSPTRVSPSPSSTRHPRSASPTSSPRPH